MNAMRPFPSREEEIHAADVGGFRSPFFTVILRRWCVSTSSNYLLGTNRELDEVEGHRRHSCAV